MNKIPFLVLFGATVFSLYLPVHGQTLEITGNLSLGMQGEEVRALQAFLVFDGLLAEDSVTGFFGELTQKAVQTWQTREGVVSSGDPVTTGFGVVGPKTRTALFGTPAQAGLPEVLGVTATTFSRNLSYGMQGEDVRQLQLFLIDEAVLPTGNATGYFGPLTQKAVGAWQVQEGIGTPTTVGYGGVGPVTRAAILTAANATKTTQAVSESSKATTAKVIKGAGTSIGAKCSFNGNPVMHGSSVVAYFTPTVSPTGSCSSVEQKRTCQNGTLSGSYTYSSCTRAGKATNNLSKIGLYQWGSYNYGTNPSESLVSGTEALQKAGFKQVVRVAIQPRHKNTDQRTGNVYRFDLSTASTSLISQCPNGTPYLPCAVRTSYYQNLFNLPGLETIVLSAYGSAETGALGWSLIYADKTSMKDAAIQQKIVDEFKAFTLALYETQHDTGRTFIISNWEADNELYGTCPGGIAEYANNLSVRNKEGCKEVPARYEALKTYYAKRFEGIKAGIQEAKSKGLGGIQVEYAIQFNAPRLGEKAGYAVLDIIKHVAPDWADYSAWEATNLANVDEDLEWIESKLPSRTKLMLGELDTAQRIAGHSASTWRWTETIRAALRSSAELFILWQAYDDLVTSLPDGLLTLTGSPKNDVKQLLSAIGNYPRNTQNGFRMNGMNDLGWHGGDATYPAGRYMEFYGDLTGTGFSARAVCDGTSMTARMWDGGSPAQKNISVDELKPTSGNDVWCTFTVNNAEGQSATMGPLRICSVKNCGE